MASGKRLLLIVRPDGTVETTLPLPAVQPEGICLDARGQLWIADDVGRSVLRIPRALETLTAALAARNQGAKGSEPRE